MKENNMPEEPSLFDPDTLLPTLAAVAPDNWIIDPDELATVVTRWATDTPNNI